jgi:hypothetical protein
VAELYEYRTIRIQRAGWRVLPRDVGAAFSRATSAAGGAVYALFAGMIGFATDEGVLMRTWRDDDAFATNGERTMTALPGIVESRAERLVVGVRPLDASPPHGDGVYAHRWFWLQPQDWAEFQRLSDEGVWPYFESDGCNIIGLWRSAEPGPLAKALLITRYPSVAHWERTRLQSPDAPPGADERLYRAAQDAGRRRAELTERSIVRLTRLLPSA